MLKKHLFYFTVNVRTALGLGFSVSDTVRYRADLRWGFRGRQATLWQTFESIRLLCLPFAICELRTKMNQLADNLITQLPTPASRVNFAAVNEADGIIEWLC